MSDSALIKCMSCKNKNCQEIIAHTHTHIWQCPLIAAYGGVITYLLYNWLYELYNR